MPDTSPGWDIVSGPGLTALGLTAARLAETSRADRLIVDPFGRAFLDAVDAPVPFPTAWPEDGKPMDDRQALHLHGSRYIGLRSRVYDDELLEATAAGIRQVVLLAAGLDTRALRLTWATGTRIFELDQPQVLAFKDDVLRRAAPAEAAERLSVGADLRGDWADALHGAGFDPGRPTAWVAEGLLAYLPPEAELALLDRVTGLSAPGSRFAADRLLSDDDGAVAQLSRRSGVDMSAMLDTSGVRGTPAALTDLGWQVQELDVESLAARYGRDLSDPFARAESSTPPWLATGFVFARRG